MCVLSFEYHLALALYFSLIGADQAIAGFWWAHLVGVRGAGAVGGAFFDKALGFTRYILVPRPSGS